MVKKGLIYFSGSFGLGLLIKYMIVNFNLVLNWQNSSGFSFSELFQHAEKVVSPYNTFIFSVAIIIMAVLFFIDWKMNQGKDGSKKSSWD